MREHIVSSFWAYAVVGAYPATLVFGLPAFLFLRGRVRPTAFRCALAGATVAAAPWLLLSVVSVPNHAALDGYAMAIDGRWTAWGWLLVAKLVAAIGAMGSLGGVVFWLVAAARLRRRTLGTP